MDYNTIGTCSICGGPVTVPTVWFEVQPPTPTCKSCGAIAHGPVIQMKPNNVRIETVGSGSGIPNNKTLLVD